MVVMVMMMGMEGEVCSAKTYGGADGRQMRRGRMRRRNHEKEE